MKVLSASALSLSLVLGVAGLSPVGAVPAGLPSMAPPSASLVLPTACSPSHNAQAPGGLLWLAAGCGGGGGNGSNPGSPGNPSTPGTPGAGGGGSGGVGGGNR